jgi:hypothetical protein
MASGGGVTLTRAQVLIQADTTNFDQAMAALPQKSSSKIAATMKALQEQINRTKLESKIALDVGDMSKVAQLFKTQVDLAQQMRAVQSAATDEASALKGVALATQEVERARKSLASAPDPASRMNAQSALEVARQKQQAARDYSQDVSSSVASVVGGAAGFAKKTGQSFDQDVKAKAKADTAEAKKTSAQMVSDQKEIDKKAADDKRKADREQKEADKKAADEKKRADKEAADEKKKNDKDADEAKRKIDDARRQRERAAAQAEKMQQKMDADEKRRAQEDIARIYADMDDGPGPGGVGPGGKPPKGPKDKDKDKRQGNLGMGVLMVSQAVEDVQYGFSAIVNNIPMIAMAAGATAGWAGAISIAAVGINVLANNLGKISGAFGMSPIKTAAEEMEELSKKTKLTADEAERLYKFNNLDAKTKELQGYRPEKEQRVNAAATHAIGEAGNTKMVEAVQATARNIIDAQGDVPKIVERINFLKGEIPKLRKSMQEAGSLEEKSPFADMLADYEKELEGLTSGNQSDLMQARRRVAGDKLSQAATSGDTGGAALKELIEMVRKDPSKFGTSGDREIAGEQGRKILHALEESTPEGMKKKAVRDEAAERGIAEANEEIDRIEAQDRAKASSTIGNDAGLQREIMSALAEGGLGNLDTEAIGERLDQLLKAAGIALMDQAKFTKAEAEALANAAEAAIRKRMASDEISYQEAAGRIQTEEAQKRLGQIIQGDPLKRRTEGVARAQDDDAQIDILKRRAAGQQVNQAEIAAGIEARLKAVGINNGAEVAQKSAKEQTESTADRIKQMMADNEGMTEVQAAARLLDEAIVDKFDRAREATNKANQNAARAAAIREEQNPPAPPPARPLTRVQQRLKKDADRRRANRQKAVDARNKRLAGGRRPGNVDAAIGGGPGLPGGFRSVPPSADAAAMIDPGMAGRVAAGATVAGGADASANWKTLLGKQDEIVKATQEVAETNRSIEGHVSKSAATLEMIANRGVVARVGA